MTWTPLTPTTIEIPAESKAAVALALRREGVADADIARFVADRAGFMNDLYLVEAFHADDGVVQAISIRRHDGAACRDWRDFQRIKNEVAGEDVEAVELYPAESRLVDSANVYWLWCCRPGSRLEFGFPRRSVMDAVEAGAIGNSQRPLDH